MTTDTTEPTDQPDSSTSNVDLGLLANVRVSMTVEVGNTQITLQDLLRLNEGSVVELDRMAGDPLDILVNGTPILRVARNLHGLIKQTLINPCRRSPPWMY